MNPTVNVNLEPCDCWASREPWRKGHHQQTCAATPVPIPCPIPPSVEFEVVLGECMSPGACSLPRPMFQATTQHLSRCPARPIRVTCSVSGKTWPDTEVVEIEVAPGTPVDTRNSLYAACRERWALVKALVLGQFVSPYNPKHFPERAQQEIRLREQRDAVYAAIAKMARAEAGADESMREYRDAMDFREVEDARQGPLRPTLMLSQYVRGLIEQVGRLP